MGRVTQEEAIRRIRAAIGDNYDFSGTVYVDYKTKMTVICAKHGEFSRLPMVFWKGAGCHSCSFKNRIDISVVLARFREAHGDCYDYSKVNYTHSQKPVIIGCRKHGDFNKTPYSHWRGSGCPRCLKIIPNPPRLTTAEALGKFTEVHGDRYDYSQVKYKKNSVHVKIVCQRHGVFEQTPVVHWSGSGCPRCSILVSKTETRWADILEKVTGWKIARQKQIDGIMGSVDMLIEDSTFGNIVVEYDGCYWHSREGSLERDERKTRLLKNAGYKVVRLREKGRYHLDPVPSAFLNHSAPQYPSENDANMLIEQLKSPPTRKIGI